MRAVQLCAAKPLEILFFLADKRRGSPKFLKKLVAIIVVPVVTYFLAITGLTKTSPSWWSHFFVSAWVDYNVAYSFTTSSITGFTCFIMLEAFLPMLFYVPSSVNMRTMGLLYTDVRPNSVQKVILRELNGHKPNTPIRIICISGSSLFMVPRTGVGDAPFSEYAEKGKVRILMPRSTPTNPTIAARYDSYSDKHKQNNYPTVVDLVAEIDRTKARLKTNGNNVLVEHDALCMWRVILFSHRCIVQNYFPNHTGEDSDDSPVFVFEKTSASCKFSYYSSFEDMFYLLSRLPREPQKLTDDEP
ncbi:MAG: hypothetical protein EPO07_12210 [Verrucomicrobia bacterium]|nr:MAG: hypothetical protein EPO07_12210 [Verrucomicrobiota bacterium]